jgi:outer membrane protein OmpU
MTNIKKIGLTALAGSLVATSAFAGAMDVTGTAKVTFVSEHESEHTQNNYTMGQTLNFAGSGEMDNGMTISYGYLMTNAALSSSTLKLDMGDMGSMHFAEGANPAGIGAYRDKMPTAGEQVWDDMGGEANGHATFPTNGTIGYIGNLGDLVDVSVSYNKNSSTSANTATTTSGNSDTRTITTNTGSSSSIVISGSPAEGATLFYGQGEKAGTTKENGTDMWTAGVTYAIGSVTAGIQQTAIDAAAANADADRLHMSASYQVNDDLAISYGMSTVEFENATLSDQEDSGFSISYTMGSMSLVGSWLESDNVSGAAATDDAHTEIALSFAF